MLCKAMLKDNEDAVDNVDEVEGVFAEYQPNLPVGMGQPHPDPVVETVSLSYVDAPAIIHQFELEKFHDGEVFSSGHSHNRVSR